MGAIRAYTRGKTDEQRAMEVQFFLNDLPGNNFNLVFRSLEQLKNLTRKQGEEIAATPPCYVTGLPGSFYSRLFPRQSVHFFHSSYALMWRSKVPEKLSNGTHLNEGNMYIGKTTPPTVVMLFQEQFQKDFELFLTLRSEELVSGGPMLLTFMSRRSEEILSHGDIGSMIELLSKSLQSLVLKGRLEEEKLDSFNVPYYAPSLDEVKALINDNRLLDIGHVGLLESSWDPEDDSDGDVVLDCARSGANAAKMIMAAGGPTITDHFGEDIWEELFDVHASMVAKHLEKGKAKYPVIMVSLKKAMHY